MEGWQLEKLSHMSEWQVPVPGQDEKHGNGAFRTVFTWRLHLRKPVPLKEQHGGKKRTDLGSTLSVAGPHLETNDAISGVLGDNFILEANEF